MTWLFPTLLVFQFTYSAASERDALAIANNRKLAASAEWLTLGQYHKSLLGGYRSRVTSSSFFLDSISGPKSPQKELEATIRALFAPIPDSADLHAACRFPARKAWLIQKGVLSEGDLPFPECKSLNQWTGKERHISLSLVFATGYLKNPASYFGHIFLKFNSSPIRSGQNLINRTVNFGADLRSYDNPILYVLKGFTGGYSGVYSQNDFYTQRYQYGDNQLRDLWEFELNLSPETVDTLSLRVWELFGKNYPYYFLNENCAYFIVKPLEDLLGKNILPQYLPYSLPKHAIESITSYRMADGKPLVRDIQYIPSRQVVFYAKYAELDNQETRAFNNLIKSKNPDFEDADYARLPVKGQKKLLDVLLDYHDYIHAGIHGDMEIDERRRQILLERLRLPSVTSGDHVFAELRAKSPTEAPKTNLLAFGTRFSDGPERLLFRWRPANHDFLSDNSGRAPNSELQVFDIEAYVSNKALGINRFDLMEVRALNSSTTGLPGDGNFAWSVRLGYGDDRIGCGNCSVFLGNAFYGYAFGNTANLILPFLFAGGQLQSPNQGSGISIFETKCGMLSNRNGPFGFFTEGGWKVYLDGNRSQAPFIETEFRVTLSRLFELRIRAGYEQSRMVSAAVNVYL